MSVTLLILHGLVAVALLGAITHQVVSAFRLQATRNASFVSRYVSVSQKTFTSAIIVLYLATILLGGIIYPNYRLNVRIPFEEMGLSWAVGIFELKEHYAGVAIGLLPLYAYVWRSESFDAQRRNRLAITLLLALIVWWDFLCGHVLNNIRGLA